MADIKDKKYDKCTRRLTLVELRKMIGQELSLLKEEKDKDDVEDSEGIPARFQNPEMTSTAEDGTGNIKDVPADEIVAQMLSGNPLAPVIKAIGAFHNPKFTPAISNKVTTKDGAKELKAWVLKQGSTFLANNIKIIQDVLPSSGLPKSQMPALEPSDVSAVKDALQPGGKFNVDISEPFAGGDPSAEKWFDKQKTEVAYTNAIKLLEKKIAKDYPDGMPGGSKIDPKGLALAFLTKGFKDNNDADDSIEVQENEPIRVADMIPTQHNIQLGKSLAFALSGGFGGQELGAYVTGDNEILDGHHRWSGTMIIDPGASIRGHKVNAPAKDIIPVLTSLGNAFGNAQKGRESAKKESLATSDNVILERWQKLAGILK